MPSGVVFPGEAVQEFPNFTMPCGKDFVGVGRTDSFQSRSDFPLNPTLPSDRLIGVADVNQLASLGGAQNRNPALLNVRQ